MSTRKTNWDVRQIEDTTWVRFSGDICEESNFDELAGTLSGNVCFHLGAIKRVNSSGVREWIGFVRELSALGRLVFTHCSPAIVSQCNMIINFHGGAEICSVYAPYLCEACDVEENKLLQLSEHFPGGALCEIPEFTCPNCQDPMIFDNIPEHWFEFLKHCRVARPIPGTEDPDQVV